MNPLDYTMDVANPVAMALRGYQTGFDQNMAQEAAATQRDQFGQQQAAQQQLFGMEQQRIGIAERNMGMQEQTFAANQQALQQEQAAAQQMQADVQELARKVANGTATAADYASVGMRNPQVVEAIRGAYETEGAEKTQTAALEMAQIFNMLNTGNVDMAKAQLQERVLAATESKNQLELDMAEAAIALIDSDPSAAMTSIGMSLQILGDGKFDGLIGGGGDEPAGVQTLRIRAQEAGLVPGTEEYRNFMLKGGADKGMSLEVGPDGTVRMTQGDVGNDPFGGKPPTEGQLASAGYLQRMRGSEDIFAGLAAAGTNALPLGAGIAIGTALEGFALSPAQGRLLQAQRDWVRAKLRKESGAVIAEEEMAAEMKTYFPIPGDGTEVIEQKRKARERADRQMQIMSGPAGGMAGEQPAATSPAAPATISMTAEEEAFVFRFKNTPEGDRTPEDRARIRELHARIKGGGQ